MKSTARRPLAILIVDDDPRILDLLAMSLRRLGYTAVLRATSADEAIEIAGTDSPGLIIMDIEMPGMNGLEATRAIRAQQSVPVIISTGRTEPALMKEAHRLNIQAYLVKPFREEQLNAAIEIALAQFAIQQDAAARIAMLRREVEAQRLERKITRLAKQPVSLEKLVSIGLTQREAEVLLAAAAGRSSAEIAAVLGIADRTVEKHIENIFAKLGVNTRAAAVAHVYDLGA